MTTKKIKNKKKTITKKYIKKNYKGGLGDSKVIKNNDNDVYLTNILISKVKSITSQIIYMLLKSGMRIIGFEPIKNQGDYQSENNSLLSSYKDSIKTKISSEFNNVLQDEDTKNNLASLSKNISNNIGELAEIFNNNFENEEVRNALKVSFQLLDEYGVIFLDSLDEPFNRFLNITTKAIGNTSNSLIKSSVTNFFTFLASIPGLGAIINLGFMVNNLSGTAVKVIGDINRTINSGSESIAEISERFDEKLKQRELSNEQKNINEIPSTISPSTISPKLSNIFKKKGGYGLHNFKYLNQNGGSIITADKLIGGSLIDFFDTNKI